MNKTRFSEAIRVFSEWRGVRGFRAQTTYDINLRQFALYLRDPYVSDVSLEDVTGYFRDLIRLGWDRNGLVVKGMAIRKFFEFCRLQGMTDFNEALVPVPQKQTKLPRVATDEQYKKLLAAIPRKTNDPRHIRNRAIVGMLWDSGARNGEVLALNLPDADTKRLRSVIRTEKAVVHRPFRQIFWTSNTNTALIRWIQKRKALVDSGLVLRDADALFISICSGALANTSGQRLSIKGVGEMLRRYSNRAGIPYLNAHSFRHRMGHHIVKQGGTNADVANILGHSSLQSTLIYTMMADKELEARYRKLVEEGG